MNGDIDIRFPGIPDAHTEGDTGHLANSMVMSGGNTLFPGFEERMQLELMALFNDRLGGRARIRLADIAVKVITTGPAWRNR